jgi:hypothetical protein
MSTGKQVGCGTNDYKSGRDLPSLSIVFSHLPSFDRALSFFRPFMIHRL